MFWIESKDGNSTGYVLARRHYSATKNKHPKIRQFVGPGQKYVLIGFMCNAVFAWRRYITDDGQAGVCCTLFRNESEHLSSLMIREACELAWNRWPGERLFTYVNPDAVRSANPGWCFLMAGFHRVKDRTRKGYHILERLPQ